MKVTLLTASLLAMLSLTACDRPGGDASRTAPAVSPEPTAAPVSGSGATELAKGDGAVLGVLAAIDDNEIALAKQAIEQDLGGATGEFAQQMLHDHEANLEKTKSLGASESPRAQAMRAKGKAAVEALSKTLTLPDGKDAYRNAFMRTMVIDHGDTIKIIDSELLPAAESAPVKQHLEQTRRVVSAHFERAHAVSSSK
ncbi:DUF4142 domain-containing protein [Xanthomonas phaseoli]|uniref:DUF4142 domain-containing protein n=1 Tax=Xanthomonas phaseoli pv. dieffenbachiae TaxID=92828 RepID=A0A1V9HD30_9XANT|nr:DUF4142 domain-containing protein [Xanthomonas phaseoli]MBO9787267.1 DUF4142 domain-containing protein [Xanthomonas phaseoli pv. dieffenbachiae]MBO9884562.1 DUF4142 domain-containing protein [Xanthomonas phaseoli pv. dieffenbachiae]MBO9915251.1 DUF4142 domain-containing protein [Xanthomonas phaseoli pv. dieffenbachiae]MBO9939392.1 DUF4142 domain-containing protein [Xanthomonas phaseoli pv. dieffenbachiae]MBO9996609.1 DUF4142 domain-containing protein [Xanthomonas phaseoli pv. dieffenbachiae